MIAYFFAGLREHKYLSGVEWQGKADALWRSGIRHVLAANPPSIDHSCEGRMPWRILDCNLVSYKWYADLATQPFILGSRFVLMARRKPTGEEVRQRKRKRKEEREARKAREKELGVERSASGHPLKTLRLGGCATAFLRQKKPKKWNSVRRRYSGGTAGVRLRYGGALP